MSAELIEAVRTGDFDSALRMLAAGADVNSRDSEGSSLLMLASHAGNLAMVLALIKAGAEVNACDERGWTPLMKAAYNAGAGPGFCRCGAGPDRRGSERGNAHQLWYPSLDAGGRLR